MFDFYFQFYLGVTEMLVIWHMSRWILESP